MSSIHGNTANPAAASSDRPADSALLHQHDGHGSLSNGGAQSSEHSDGDSLPGLVNSESEDADYLDDVPEHESASGYHEEEAEDSDEDIEDEDDLSEEDDMSEEGSQNGDDLLPELVNMPAQFRDAGAGRGDNAPLDLDQQSALDSLSRQLDETEILIASVRQVLTSHVT